MKYNKFAKPAWYNPYVAINDNPAPVASSARPPKQYARTLSRQKKNTLPSPHEIYDFPKIKN